MIQEERQRQQRLNNNIYLEYKEMEEDEYSEQKSFSVIPSNREMLVY